jgi:outer membrane murein-binding lipoprotein Lpp
MIFFLLSLISFFRAFLTGAMSGLNKNMQNFSSSSFFWNQIDIFVTQSNLVFISKICYFLLAKKITNFLFINKSNKFTIIMKQRIVLTLLVFSWFSFSNPFEADAQSRRQQRREEKEKRKAEEEAKKLEKIEVADPKKLGKDDLRTQNTMLRTTIGTLEAENSKLKTRTSQLESEVEVLKTDKARLAEELENAKKDNQALSADYEALAAEFEALKAKFEATGSSASSDPNDRRPCRLLENKLATNSSYFVDSFNRLNTQGWGLQLYSFNNLCAAMEKAVEFRQYYRMWKTYITVKEINGKRMFTVVYGSMKDELQARTYLQNFRKIARDVEGKNAFLIQHSN